MTPHNPIPLPLGRDAGRGGETQGNLTMECIRHLVLTRKPGETFILEVDDKPITVTVYAVRGNNVRLGIRADHRVAIIREELLAPTAAHAAHAACEPPAFGLGMPVETWAP